LTTIGDLLTYTGDTGLDAGGDGAYFFMMPGLAIFYGRAGRGKERNCSDGPSPWSPSQ
jgi:hypothetical protein